MSQAQTTADGREKIRRVLGPYAEDLDDAAATEDDPARADACAILAALARGEDPPEAACRRAVRRAREGDI